VFCGLIPLGRGWLRSGVAISDSRIILVPLEQMCGGEDQAIIFVSRLRGQIPNEQPKRAPPSMAVVVVSSQGVDVDPGAGLEQG